MGTARLALFGTIVLSGFIAVANYEKQEFVLTTDSKKNISLVKKAAKRVFGDGVVADTAVAQAILESNLSGKPSTLALEANNLFGIKYNPKYDDRYIELLTSECTGKKCSKVQARFAKYTSVRGSFDALNRLYNKANYSAIFKAKTCLEAAQALKKGGYATDPNYVKKVSSICYKVQKNLI